MKNWITLLFILITPWLFAQKEGYNWYFGDFSAVSFNTGKPVAIKNSAMFARLGSSTISSSTGKLQFYSNGINVFNMKDSVMVKKLAANSSLSAQNSLIVPWPDSSHLYYIFTPPAYPNESIAYSLINMKLKGGLGDTVIGGKNIRLPTASSGKVNAVRHANHRDYWVVMPSGNSDSIHAYLITPAGIIKPPVKSKTGIKIKYEGGFGTPGFGYFKLSPDGKKLCDVNYGDSSMIADFDSETGKVSNVWGFNYRCFCISAEFSAKSNYLYMPIGSRKLAQYDINTASKAEFLASKKTIDSSGKAVYGNSCFQVAPDGKIYFTEYDVAYLHVIHAPDSAGKYSRVQKNVVPIFVLFRDGAVHTGLPDFIQSFFHKPSFRVRLNCANDSVFFTIKDSYKLDSVHWNFGDTVSGISNFSTQTKNVFHHYKKLGFYKVRLISFHKTYTDTIYETFILKPLKPNIGKDTNFCRSKYLLLSPNEVYAGYKWSTTQTVKSIYVTNPGTYVLIVSDYDGCIGSDTIKISKPIIKADFTINDSSQCIRVNNFILKENSTYTGGLRKKSSWFFKDSIICKDSLVNLSFKEIGSYQIKLLSESYGGCRDSITKTLSVYPNTNVGFVINDSSQCFNQHSFDFIINKDTGKISYEWDLGDQSITMGKDVIAKRYLKTGNYKVSLTATTDKNCKDTAVKSVTILPNPKADFTYDLACSRTITKFQFTGTKSPSPITTYFNWDFNKDATSTLENPSHKFAAAGTSTSTLILASDNGCTDTMKKVIEIKTQSKAEFTTNDVCESDSAVFINKSLDATSYNWKFGDGNTSKSQNPKHKFQISSTTTFNVTLVAVVTNGCSDSLTKALTVNSNPDSDFSFTTTGTKVDLIATVQGNSKYQWKFGNTDSTATTVGYYSHNIKSTDQYKVCLKVTNLAGCTSQTCKNVTLGISDISKSSGFKIYPNPNDGNFIIEIENPEKEVSIEVYDVMGRMVKKVERVEKVVRLDLDVEDGIYLVRVKNDGLVWNQKVFVLLSSNTNR